VSAVPGSSTDLGLSISFADGAAVAVAGELDLASGPDLAAVLDALIDRGHRSVTIDCSKLGFIDASGLGILAAAYARLLRTDGKMRLREVSGLAYRICEITDLLGVLHVEAPNPNSRPEIGDAGETDPITWQATRLAANSARADAVADTLSRMTVLIPEVITACDGASVTLRRPDYLMTAAASDDTFRDLDDIQYADRQGPCLEAATIGVQTHASALTDEQRWQSFTPQAREHGIESILSSPLIVDDQPMGALNLYSRTPHSFLPIHLDLANVFATQTAILLQEPELTTGREFDDRIQDALASRDIIAQAQGVLMARLGTDADAAYVALRRDSVRTSIPLRAGAGKIVAETQPRSAPPHTNGPANE
jgi:anti-anti-sigma factor